METARVPDNWRKSMMGHSLGQTQGAYSRPHVEDLLRTYKDAYKYLTVEGSMEPKGMTAEDIAEVMAALASKDKTAIAKIVEKYGEEHPLSKLMKQQITVSEAKRK
jgi:hypothetical protein